MFVHQLDWLQLIHVHSSVSDVGFGQSELATRGAELVVRGGEQEMNLA